MNKKTSDDSFPHEGHQRHSVERLKRWESLEYGMSDLKLQFTWPSDLVAIERYLPNSARGYQPWREISLTGHKSHELVFHDGRNGKPSFPDPPKNYYIPAEVCDPIGYEWFYQDDDPPRSDAELLGMRMIARERGANLLFNVPPDRRGLIPEEHIDALRRLRRNVERMDAAD